MSHCPQRGDWQEGKHSPSCKTTHGVLHYNLHRLHAHGLASHTSESSEASGLHKSLEESGLGIGELISADGAGAVVVQPLADAALAEAVLAGQLHDLGAALEGVHADVALAAQVSPASTHLRRQESSPLAQDMHAKMLGTPL